MGAGGTSQTTPVQFMHAFVFCVVLLPTCAILIPVRILLVIWCVLFDDKVNNLTGEFWVASLGFPSLYNAILYVISCCRLW